MAAASDQLLAILVTFLTPLFLGEATGNHDLATARAAATEAVQSFRPRNAWELLTAVQAVAFAMAALGSIGLSLDDTLSASAVLRCRANANALQRAADRAQDRLEKRRAQRRDQPEIAPMSPDEVQASLRQAAAAQHAAAAARAALAGQPPPASPVLDALADAARGPGAAPERAPPPPSRPAAQPAAASGPAAGVAQPTNASSRPPERRLLPDRHQVAWASAMANVARELSQDIAHLPPAEQRLHRLRIAALTEASQQLASGAPPQLPPGFPGLPMRATPPVRRMG
ncbi:MAG: hypothetical protein U1E70_06270 [Acetobacteraceae bacterium]